MLNSAQQFSSLSLSVKIKYLLIVSVQFYEL